MEKNGTYKYTTDSEYRHEGDTLITSYEIITRDSETGKILSREVKEDRSHDPAPPPLYPWGYRGRR